jgi:hypothetical protein
LAKQIQDRAPQQHILPNEKLHLVGLFAEDSGLLLYLTDRLAIYEDEAQMLKLPSWTQHVFLQRFRKEHCTDGAQ